MVVEPAHVIVVGRDMLLDPNVVEIIPEVKRHMEGLTHGIDDTVVDDLPL